MAVIPIAVTLPTGESESFLLFPRPFGLDLDLTFSCNHAALGTEIGFFSSDPATLNWFFSNGTTLFVSGDVLPGGNVLKKFGFDNARIEGQFIFAEGPHVATVKVHAFDGGTFCELRGTVVYASSA